MRCNHTLRSLFCLASVLIASNDKLAFCECDYDWEPGQRILGAGDIVRASTSWDPDGDGPQAELLVAGGSFTAIGAVRANRIAAWDGENWAPLGAGFDGIVRALATHDGELIAAGDFINTGGLTVNRIARWDGVQWHDMEGGTDARVYTLLEFNGVLIAGGDFMFAGGHSVSHLAQWNADSWAPIGGGLAWPVRTLIEFNGSLHSGGGGVHRWNGASWTALGSAPLINALAIYNGQLVCSSDNAFTDGNPNHNSHVGRWSGASWVPLFGNGLTPNDDVYALEVFNGELYAGGYFSMGGGMNRVIRWNGTGWTSVTVGVNNTVFTLEQFQGRLIAGGQFYRCGFVEAHRIASWDGVAWRPIDAHPEDFLAISTNSHVEWKGQVFAAGQFLYPGGDSEYYVARRQGNQWEPIGSYADDSISDIVVFNDTLVACGSFLEIGGIGAGRIAQWDEADGWRPLGAGMNNPVSTVAVIGTDLYAGGHFTEADSWIANRLARWDGKGWLPIENVGMNGAVHAIIEFDGALTIGGTFTNAGGTLAVGMARWSGSQWQPMGSPFGVGNLGIVIIYALTQYDGRLIAAGDFTISGTNDIAQWTGTQWLPISGGLGGFMQQPYVLALAEYDDDLYAGGGFITAGGLPISYLARWNGATWTDLDGGVTSSIGTPLVRSLYPAGESLLVGGSFYLAGDQVSTAMAQWHRVPLLADFDFDCDVDLVDFGQFSLCLVGPETTPSEDCLAVETSSDNFIDLLDFTVFQNQFTSASD